MNKKCINWVQWGRRNNFTGINALADHFTVNAHICHVRSFDKKIKCSTLFYYKAVFIFQEFFRRLTKDSLDLGSNLAINLFHGSVLKKIKNKDCMLYTIANGWPIIASSDFKFKIHEQVSCAYDLAKLRNQYQNANYDLSEIYERERKTFECADLILCPSLYVKKYVEGFGHGRKAVLVHYPRPKIEDHYPIDNKIRNNSKLNFVFAGRIEYVKGVSTIFKLAEDFPTVNFHLAGDILIDIPKNDNLFFYGKVSQDRLFQILKSCDALIFPSLSEGSSFVTLEAFSLGLPGIVSLQSGSHYKSNHTGYVCNAFEYNEFKMAIDKIKTNPEELINMKNNVAIESSVYSYEEYKANLVSTIRQFSCD